MLTYLLIGSSLIVIVSSYLRAPPPVWLLVFFLLFSSASLLFDIALVPIVILWGIFLICSLTLLVTPVRRRLLTAPLFHLFRRNVPKLSLTEQEALDAGTVWWDGELFSGKPDWRCLLSYPDSPLSGEEQAFLDGPVEELCGMLDDWRITDTDQDLPAEIWEYLIEHRFFAMIIPRVYGGLGFSARAHSEVVMKLSTRSVTTAVTVMVPNSLGPGMLLLEYGTEKQKQYYLPRLASGTEIPCFALTSPAAGSDAASMTDHGVVCYDEFDGDPHVLGIRLNWNKRYITLVPVAPGACCHANGSCIQAL